MAMQLTKATRKKVKLRMGLSAVSGGGKTYSALKLGKGLVGSYDKIAVIDTENDSASLYSHLGDFNVISLRPPFSPERYIEAIKSCEAAGMELIIIDSIAHEWEGEGGVLELCETFGGGFQDGWKKMTPRHEKFKQAILQSTAHVITTVRRKTEYALQERQNKAGKTVQAPVKVGLKEVTREGWEYDVTVNLEIDINHYATSSKDRTGLFMDKDPFIISEKTGELIKDWCETGIDPNAERLEQLQTAINTILATKDFDVLESLKLAQPTTIVSDGSFNDTYGKRYTVLLAEAVKVATKKIKAASTLDELKDAFLSNSKPVQEKIVSVKDAKKLELSPATTPAS